MNEDETENLMKKLFIEKQEYVPIPFATLEIFIIIWFLLFEVVEGLKNKPENSGNNGNIHIFVDITKGIGSEWFVSRLLNVIIIFYIWYIYVQLAILNFREISYFYERNQKNGI